MKSDSPASPPLEPDPSVLSHLAGVVALDMQHEARTLALQWLERLKSILPLESNDVFPSASLLDHIPNLIAEIARYIGVPGDVEIAANTAVIEKARELGALRHAQRASIHQLLREYELLADVLEEFVVAEVAELRPATNAVDSVTVLRRVGRAVRILMRTTVDTFAERYLETINEQTRQLESFNRMAGHELRNPLGTVAFAMRLLAIPEMAEDAQRRTQIVARLERGVSRLTSLVEVLQGMATRKAATDSPTSQLVDVAQAARDVAGQLDEMAQARGVAINIAPHSAAAVLDLARLELVLVNLLSNAVKYADPDKTDRIVDVCAAPAPDGGVVLTVRDNGIGIPADTIGTIFTPLTRVHADRDIELGADGMGLGLAIVKECVDAMGGTIACTSRVGDGTTFVVTLPSLDTAAKTG